MHAKQTRQRLQRADPHPGFAEEVEWRVIQQATCRFNVFVRTHVMRITPKAIQDLLDEQLVKRSLFACHNLFRWIGILRDCFLNPGLYN
jgi:hypothetical protein